ncbi:MAG: AAA family ATPase [Gammaproteobacteria bacterium]
MKKRWKDASRSPLQFLMTQERTQLLDLLKHLLSNSNQPIIVCGPKGIGKTTLLKILQRDEFISFRNLSADYFAGATTDSIQGLLDRTAKQDKREKHRHSHHLEDPKAEKPRNVCLIIDNAGALTAGIMSRIIHLVNEDPCLRLIFVMTHDQLYLKNRSDQAIEDCHIIEVPPFTKEQSGDFLLHLSSKTSAAVPKNAITDSLIENIYRQTEGMPAGIIAKFPDLVETNVEKDPTWLLIFAVASLVAVALLVQLFSSGQPFFKEVNSPVRSVQKDYAAELRLMHQIMPALASADTFQYEFLQADLYRKLHRGQGTEWASALSGNGKKLSAIGALTAAGQVQAISRPEITTVSKTAISALPGKKEPGDSLRTPAKPAPAHDVVPTAVETAPEQEASAWLASQPDANYTLQLMVLSKEQAILGAIKKYPDLRKNFKYVKTVIKGREKFVLLYGSFNDKESAQAARQALPAELRSSLIRKMTAVVNDFGKVSAIE